MTTEEKTDGPSKNELKKMAKKAAKKQQAGGAGGGDGGGTAPAAAAASAAPIVESPVVIAQVSVSATPAAAQPKTLLLANAKANDAATLKVVWASHHFQVPLQGANQTQAAKAKETSFFIGHDHALLMYGETVIGGGGNAMAQAIAGMAADAPATTPWMVDEWCEWERTVLRPAATTKSAAGGDGDKKALTAALEYLESKLTGGLLHLLHHTHSDSVADICVLTTLMTTDISASWDAAFPNIARYVQVHQSALETAHKAVDELIASSASSSSTSSKPLDLEALYQEARLMTVVDLIFTQTVRELFGNDIELPVRICKECQNIKHGDYQCTAAMPVYGALQKKNASGSSFKSPKDVAEAIVEALGSNHPILSELQVTTPGFVLCRLRPEFLQRHVNAFLPNGRLPCQHMDKPQVCVVDFSSPNIAKEMHVGHLRSTIIGESVCRILESVGATVHRVNHVGDWGTQFGMLIQYLREEFPSVTESDDLPNISDLTEFYKAAKQRFDENENDFKKKSQLNVVQLQSGDPECRKIWQMLCDVSRREFEKVYKRLDVTVTECGESFYNDKIPPVIEEFTAAGKIRIEEGGAKCVFLGDAFKIPLMLQKSDGGFGYDSTDMAALKYRLFDLKADRIIYITDFSQGDHFKMVFAAGHEIGWIQNGQKLDHIGFGTVMGEDGKRFKTRSGETVRLVDLLDEAVNRMEASLKERIQEGKANITLEDVHSVAEAIGYGAVKYFDLRRNPTSNYKFSYDQMLSTTGDTAVYLLYARVRMESIAAKAEAEFNVNINELLQNKDEQIVIEHASERNLALHLLKFADAMEQTLDDLFPYHICDYVYKLSIAASDFVTQCKVLGSPEMKSRLLLCHATTLAMKQCFDLLGIRDIKRI